MSFLLSGSRGDAIPDSVVFQPQSNELDNFTEIDGSDVFSVTSNTVLPFSDNEIKAEGSDLSSEIESTSGLEFYPQVGKTHSYYYHPRISQSGQDHRFSIRFAEGYSIDINGEDGENFTLRTPNSSDTDNTTPPDIPMVIETLHEDNGEITVTIYDASVIQSPDEDYRDEDIIATLSTNDTGNITDGEYDQQKVGFRYFRQNDDRIQLWRTD